MINNCYELYRAMTAVIFANDGNILNNCYELYRAVIFSDIKSVNNIPWFLNTVIEHTRCDRITGNDNLL